MAAIMKSGVQKTDNGWGFIHPFSKTLKSGFSSRAVAREALRSIKGNTEPADTELDASETEVNEVVPAEPMPTRAEVDEAFEAITGVPRPEPLAPDGPEEPTVPLSAVSSAFSSGVVAPKVSSIPKAPKVADVNGYRLKSGDKYLRRDQPRKPGELATYKVVELSKATVIKTLRQAEVKVAEVNSLYPDLPVALEVIE